MISKSLLISTAALSIAQTATAKDEKPNVLFILADDQAYNTVSALYDTGVKTPNLDRLVKNGVTFTHAYNQGSWSPAVCICSRAMIISGLNLNTARTKLKQVPHWGETFRKNGYDTFMTGKWHNGAWSVHRSFSQGGPVGPGMPPSTKPGKEAYHRPAPGNEWTPYDKKWGGHWAPRVSKYDPAAKNENKCLKGYVGEKHTSELYADSAVDYLENSVPKSDKPFFMYVAFNAPHDPRQSPKKFVDMYPADKIKLPKNFLPEHPFNQGHNKIRDEILAPFPRTQDQIKVHLQEYFAIITHMDYQLGRILDALEKSGKSKNTYVVFTADHGLACGSHGLMGKQNQYEHSVRAPFIFTGPGIPKNKQVDNMAYISCVYPTTCDLVGIKKPETIETKSLAGILRGEKEGGYDTIFGSYFTMQKMVKDKRFKLIEYDVNGEKNTQLFDLKNDKDEINNLAKDSKFAKKIEELRAKYAEAQKDGIFLDSKPKKTKASH